MRVRDIDHHLFVNKLYFKKLIPSKFNGGKISRGKDVKHTNTFTCNCQVVTNSKHFGKVLTYTVFFNPYH